MWSVLESVRMFININRLCAQVQTKMHYIMHVCMPLLLQYCNNYYIIIITYDIYRTLYGLNFWSNGNSLKIILQFKIISSSPHPEKLVKIQVDAVRVKRLNVSVNALPYRNRLFHLEKPENDAASPWLRVRAIFCHPHSAIVSGIWSDWQSSGNSVPTARSCWSVIWTVSNSWMLAVMLASALSWWS